MKHEEPTRLRDRLMRDHAELIELIRKLVAAFEANARDDMASSWTELEVRLTAHLDAEEKHLFPLLAEREPEYVRVLLAEHARFRRELLDLGVRVDLHTIRMEATNEFIDLLGDHARREDELLYRWADEHATATQRDAVLANIR